MVRLFNAPDGGYAPRFHYEEMQSELARRSVQAECKPDGSFQFEHLADGGYFALTDVTWLLRWAHEGNGLGGVTHVQGGKTIELTLQHRDRPPAAVP